jgi:hypothetical protein
MKGPPGIAESEVVPTKHGFVHYQDKVAASSVFKSAPQFSCGSIGTDSACKSRGLSGRKTEQIISPRLRTPPTGSPKPTHQKRSDNMSTGSRATGGGEKFTPMMVDLRQSKAQTSMLPKYLCTFYVQIPHDKSFNVRQRILGAGGTNLKRIATRCSPSGQPLDYGLKMRLRGTGSGFKEHESGAESSDPLQLNLSVLDPQVYQQAKAEISALFQKVYLDYQAKYGGEVYQVNCVEHPHNGLETHPRNTNPTSSKTSSYFRRVQ